MFCRNCGAKIDNEKAVVCVNCGCSIRSSGTDAPVSKSTKCDTAILLCVFFGAFGVHRFYLGDTRIGALQLVLGLLSCGCISGLWAIYDFVLLLTGNFRTERGQLITN